MRKTDKGRTARRRAKSRRAKSGARGSGGFFHIQVQPRTEFVSFRNQDVGARGGIERVAARKVLSALGSTPHHLGGERFIAKPHRNIPESEMPTPAMRRARVANIRKAQAASSERRCQRA